MRRYLVGIAVGMLMSGLLVFAGDESVTLTTYYPSPRGVYDELRANRYSGLSGSDPYVLDMTTGTLDVTRVVLRDPQTGRRFGLRVNDRHVLITDLEEKRDYLLLDTAK